MRKRHKFPLIGSNRSLGAAVTILGDTSIGEERKIGAGAVVIEDVPASAVVVGVPAGMAEQTSAGYKANCI